MSVIPYSCREACLAYRRRYKGSVIVECRGYKGPTHSIHPQLLEHGYDYHLVVWKGGLFVDPTARQLNTRLHSETRWLTLPELLSEWETIGLWKEE